MRGTNIRVMLLIFMTFHVILFQLLASGQTLPEKPAMRLGKGVAGQVAYSPDGKLLAVAGSFGIWLYDAHALDEVGLLQGHAYGVPCIAFSSDGKLLASSGWDETIRLWDVQERKQIGSLAIRINKAAPVAFSPDARLLASGGTIMQSVPGTWENKSRWIPGEAHGYDIFC
jgi:WD40 repeat protein